MPCIREILRRDTCLVSRSGWIPWLWRRCRLIISGYDDCGDAARGRSDCGLRRAAPFILPRAPHFGSHRTTTVRIERGFRVFSGDIKRSPTRAAQPTCARRFGSELFKSANPRQARLRRASFPRVCLLNASYAVLSSSKGSARTDSTGRGSIQIRTEFDAWPWAQPLRF